MDSLDMVFQVMGSTLRLAVPLLCACLAGLWSERAGVVNIALEGKMLTAAFAAAVAAHASGQAMVGLLAAVVFATLAAGLHAFATVLQRGNQIVSGVAINMLALGLTAVLGHAWFQQGGRTPALEGAARFPPLALPGVETLREVPLLGPLVAQTLSGHSLITWLALAAVPLTWWVLARSRLGLRLRAVGENPAAVDTAGISVTRLRVAGVLIGGALCGLGGAYLATAEGAGFINGMTAGKGFIALAALIFAKWRAWPALGACLLFGFLDAAAIRLQGVPLPGIGLVPVQAIQALPYALTVILLAGFIGRAVPPKAIGVPYVKER